MSDALSTIGSAAVTTVGTVAVAGAAIKAVGKATGNMNRGNKKHYSVMNHGKSSKRKSSKSMLGF